MIMCTSVQSMYVGCLFVDTSVGTNYIHFGNKSVVLCLIWVGAWMDVLVTVCACACVCVCVCVCVLLPVACMTRGEQVQKHQQRQ